MGDDKQLWLSNPLIYDQLVKVEPLQRALNELNIKIWITGRRRDQGGNRSSLRILEIDEDDGRYKLNPLAFWTNQMVWEYISKNKGICNPLYYQGYKSIGDEMTTKPVSEMMMKEVVDFFKFLKKQNVVFIIDQKIGNLNYHHLLLKKY